MSVMEERSREHRPDDLHQDDFEDSLLDRPLAEVLGIKIQYAPDELAPPVQMDRLRAYVRRELSPCESDWVTKLIATFHCWHVAWGDVLRERTPE